MMFDYVGKQLGNYRLTHLLKEGRFAQIYLGEHVYLKKQVAIKVLQSRVAGEMESSFLHEAQIIARLEHPHIVRILDFGIENQVSFLVMSYAPNGTLRQRHQEGSRLPLTTIASYLKQVAAALQYAHEQNVIHRDVKPQNMLIGLNDEVLLSDFGLAIVSHTTSSQHPLTQTGMLTYIAPEQFQGKACPASDQYALGIVVYEWLCGKPPFHGSDREIVISHQSASPLPLREQVPTISSTLEQVVLKALAKYPEERFTSVEEFANAFERACHIPLSPGNMIKPLSIFNLHHQATPYLTSLVSSPLFQSSTANHPEGFSQAKAGISLKIALITTIFVILIGSIGLLYPTLISSQHHHTSTHATTTTHANDTVIINRMMAGFDAQHTNFNPYERVLNTTNVSHLVRDWTISSDAIGSSSVIANGIVYISSQEDKLYAFDAKTGKIRWTNSPGGAYDSTPAVANGIVYTNSQDGKLYAYDATIGKRLWSISISDTSNPAVTNGIVYVGSRDHNLYAIAASTGKRLWSVSTGDVISSTPAVSNDIIYVGCQGQNLYAFNAFTGKQIWKAQVSSAGSLDSVSSPMVANGIVYVYSDYDKLYAFDASTGKQLWTALGVSSALALANGIVFAGSVNSFNAFDAFTGKRLWTATTGGANGSVVANGIVFVSSVDSVYAFDVSNGHLLWAAPSANQVYNSPVVVNGVVYFGWDGGLYAYHLPGMTP